MVADDPHEGRDGDRGVKVLEGAVGAHVDEQLARAHLKALGINSTLEKHHGNPVKK